MTEIPGIGDERTLITVGPIAVPGGAPLVLKLPRFDYLPPDTHDALFDDLINLDVDTELVAVANDLAETPVGTAVVWQPLSKQARRKLIDLGVTVTRIVEAKRREDELVAKSDEVLKNLEPYSDRSLEPLHKRVRRARLTALKHVVTAEQYAVCEKLTSGQLNEIWTQWETKSDISLGEFLASENS